MRRLPLLVVSLVAFAVWIDEGMAAARPYVATIPVIFTILLTSE